MEALACQEMLIRGEGGTVLLVWSFMHADETILCPFPERKHAAFRLAALCKVRVGPEEEIYELAKSFQQKGRLSAKDAIHLACASYIGADVFLTCDDAFSSLCSTVNLPTMWKSLGGFMRDRR